MKVVSPSGAMVVWIDAVALADRVDDETAVLGRPVQAGRAEGRGLERTLHPRRDRLRIAARDGVSGTRRLAARVVGGSGAGEPWEAGRDAVPDAAPGRVGLAGGRGGGRPRLGGLARTWPPPRFDALDDGLVTELGAGLGVGPQAVTVSAMAGASAGGGGLAWTSGESSPGTRQDPAAPNATGSCVSGRRCQPAYTSSQSLPPGADRC